MHNKWFTLKQQNISFAHLKGTADYGSHTILFTSFRLYHPKTSPYNPLLMLTGQDAFVLDAPSLVLLFYWAPNSFLGLPRNSTTSLVLSSSIELYPPQVLKCSCSTNYFEGLGIKSTTCAAVFYDHLLETYLMANLVFYWSWCSLS